MSGGPVPVWKKYTTRPQGIWEKIRQLLVLVPNRSSGNPLVSLFRQVPPGDQQEISKVIHTSREIIEEIIHKFIHLTRPKSLGC